MEVTKNRKHFANCVKDRSNVEESRAKEAIDVAKMIKEKFKL